MAANDGVDIPDVEVWQQARKKKDPKPNEDPYYGSTTETVSDYSNRLFISTICTNIYHAYGLLLCLFIGIKILNAVYSSRFEELYGPDSQPLQQPIDETALLLAGGGKPHGRFKILNVVVPSTTTLTRVKATTGATASIPPRAPRREVSFFSFLSEFRLLIMHVYGYEIHYVKL